jgi:MFS family permease
MTDGRADPTTDPPKRRMRSSLAPLARPAYRRLWLGQSVSSAGDALATVASVLAILRIGGTATDIGLLAAVLTVARVVFTLFGGVWADRLPRQFVMLASDVLRAGVQAVIAGLLIAGVAHVWQLVVGAAIYGAAQAFFDPASTGLVPETVPADQLQQANALMSFSSSFLWVAGPAVAGVLVAAFGPGPVFAVDAASFIVSAISLGMLRLAPRALPERTSLWKDLAVGWHEMAIRPWYWLNLIAHALWNFAIPALWVLGPVIATRLLGGPSAWGAISASWAAGSVAGGVVALHLRPRRPLVAANLALVPTALPILAMVRPLPLWLIAVAAVAGGMGLVFLNTLWMATMQQLIPDQVRSRVDSYDWLISLVVTPVGYVLIGPVAAAIGDAKTLIVCAVLLAVPCCLVTLIPGIRAVRRLPDGKISGPSLRGSPASSELPV